MSKPIHTTYNQIVPFITKDGSVVRELMHPAVHANQQQSLAEAIVPVGGATLLHRHHHSEEIYHFTRGQGVMTCGEERFPVKAGDTVCIVPGTPHCVENTGRGPLKILCACSPPYLHDDTTLI